METVLLQTSLESQEIEFLRKEFLNYRFLLLPYYQEQYLTKDEWKNIEILYGSFFTPENLKDAEKIRWVHVPNANLRHICFPEILERGGIIVTTGGEQSVQQVAEYVMGSILAFAKHLFHWSNLKNKPDVIWNDSLRDGIWSLEDKILLQIGLGKGGTEIARRAQEMKMRVWGVQAKATFHPYCNHTVAVRDLPLALPLADVVCLNFPRMEENENFLGKTEINLLKKDAILIALGAYNTINEEALIEQAGKLRGIILDASFRPKLSSDSPLWSLPNVIITPEIATRPNLPNKEAFHIFHYNLRQYGVRNFSDMRNRID